MSRVRRDIKRRKLSKLISQAEDQEFLLMIWAVHVLQLGHKDKAAQFLRFPIEAIPEGRDSHYAIHEWELETLVTLRLTHRKFEVKSGINRVLDCKDFRAVAHIVNLLRQLEDAESAIYLKNNSVLIEMHRIAHRQFAWQAGFFNKVHLYKYAYIYGGMKCSEFIEKTYGLTLNDLSAVGVALYHVFLEQPYVSKKIDMSFLGIDATKVGAAINMLSASLEAVRSNAIELQKSLGGGQPLGYRPSALRGTPILRIGDPEMLSSPLPELIVQRVTSGLFYDLIKGGSHLRNEASLRFESYCKNLLHESYPSLLLRDSYKYKTRSGLVDSPDFFIYEEKEMRFIVECKARKLTVGAQFADDPILSAKAEYSEIVKAIIQIWRFLGHLRLGVAGEYKSDSVIGVVLTLDPWLQVSGELRDQIIAEARLQANSYPEISDQVICKIAFVSIEELEKTILSADQNELFSSLAAATEERFRGWALSNVNQQLHGGAKAYTRPFPFELGEVLPWIRWLDGLMEERGLP